MHAYAEYVHMFIITLPTLLVSLGYARNGFKRLHNVHPEILAKP